MLRHATTSLLPWDQLEVSPTRGLIKEARRAIPDGELLATLNARRHNGCSTYPVSVRWGVLLLSIIRRPTSIEACLEELTRNAPLRLLIGIESEEDVPNGWNLTRFPAVLGQPARLDLLRHIFAHMVQRLGPAVPDLGRHTAGDSTGLRGRREPNEPHREAEIADGWWRTLVRGPKVRAAERWHGPEGMGHKGQEAPQGSPLPQLGNSLEPVMNLMGCGATL